jgi:hypothetical protein
LVRVDEEAGRKDLVDDLMFEAAPDGTGTVQRQWVHRLRMFWRSAIRWPYWPVTVLVVLAVLATLIYFAVGLIAGFFSGIVE